MGLEGYPDGIWYAIECLAEVILMFHFFMQILIRNTNICTHLQ